jgi:hypothetical protein
MIISFSFSIMGRRMRMISNAGVKADADGRDMVTRKRTDPVVGNKFAAIDPVNPVPGDGTSVSVTALQEVPELVLSSNVIVEPLARL